MRNYRGGRDSTRSIGIWVFITIGTTSSVKQFQLMKSRMSFNQIIGKGFQHLGYSFRPADGRSTVVGCKGALIASNLVQFFFGFLQSNCLRA